MTFISRPWSRDTVSVLLPSMALQFFSAFASESARCDVFTHKRMYANINIIVLHLTLSSFKSLGNLKVNTSAFEDNSVPGSLGIKLVLQSIF